MKGIVTGYGSKLWKKGLDFVVSGGFNAPVKIPFGATVIDVVKGFSNPTQKPLASATGKKQNSGFGNQVKVRLPDGSEVWLSHLENVNVEKGQTLRPGSVVGLQGNTGSTYGPTGIHVDITGKKPDGSYYTPEEVAKLFKSFA
jgi:murein DD-endopeptidase MepM/ murein hydrolase activator NlpD